MIRGWASWWSGEEPAEALAAVRILLPLVVLADLVTMARVDAVTLLWGPVVEGGIGRSPKAWFFWWDAISGFPHSGWWMWGGQVTCLVLLLLGIAPRAAAAGFALLSAQAGMILPGADRGIDALIRNACWILAFSRCGDSLSVLSWWRTGALFGRSRPIPAWPRRLLWTQLLVMYFLAGVQKFGVGWTPAGDFSALWVITHDWAVTRSIPGNIDAPWLYQALRVGTLVTIVWEWATPFLFLATWVRGRAGRLGDWVRRNRPDDLWVGAGVCFHVGIAFLLDLGIFPFAMLALYPAFVRYPRSERASTPPNASRASGVNNRADTRHNIGVTGSGATVGASPGAT